MALMLGKLYDALREAGATDDTAREASEEVAAFDRRLARIEILVAVDTAVLGVPHAADRSYPLAGLGHQPGRPHPQGQRRLSG